MLLIILWTIERSSTKRTQQTFVWIGKDYCVQNIECRDYCNYCNYGITVIETITVGESILRKAVLFLLSCATPSSACTSWMGHVSMYRCSETLTSDGPINIVLQIVWALARTLKQINNKKIDEKVVTSIEKKMWSYVVAESVCSQLWRWVCVYRRVEYSSENYASPHSGSGASTWSKGRVASLHSPTKENTFTLFQVDIHMHIFIYTSTVQDQGGVAYAEKATPPRS